MEAIDQAKVHDDAREEGGEAERGCHWAPEDLDAGAKHLTRGRWLSCSADLPTDDKGCISVKTRERERESESQDEIDSPMCLGSWMGISGTFLLPCFNPQFKQCTAKYPRIHDPRWILSYSERGAISRPKGDLGD